MHVLAKCVSGDGWVGDTPKAIMTKPEHSYNGGRGKEIDVHVIPCDSWLFYSREANLFQTQTDSFNFIFGFLFTPVSTQCTECYLHTCPFSAHCQSMVSRNWTTKADGLKDLLNSIDSMQLNQSVMTMYTVPNTHFLIWLARPLLRNLL